MANFLGNPESIASGWGPPPQLHAPEIGSLVGSILRNRLEQQALTQKNIADAIKNVREERQSTAYIEAAKAAGLIPQDYEAGGVGGAKYGTGLAKMIQDKREADALEAHRKAMEGFMGRRLDIAEADQGDDGTLDPAEQRRQDAEKRREEDDRIKALQSSMKAAELPKDAVPHALAPGETVQKGMYPFDVGGTRQDMPQGRVDDFNTARRVYDALNKQRAQIPSRGGSAAVGGGAASDLAQDYGNKVSDADVQALAWARAHPDDPRSAAILQKLGIK